MNVNTNPVLPHIFPAIDPLANALHAIEERNAQALHELMKAGEVNAFTSGHDNVSLLMRCVQQDFAEGFSALASALETSDALGLNQTDNQGNTVFHHLAMNANDADFSPDTDSPWQDALQDLLEK